MRTFCSHNNISGKHFYLMQTFAENKFVLMRVIVQTTWMKMFADVKGPYGQYTVQQSDFSN